MRPRHAPWEKQRGSLQGQSRFAASAVICNADGEILLIREADSRVYGKWNLPGGHAEPGESPFDAACREVREEVGLEVRPDALLGIYRHADGGLNYVFTAHADPGVEPVIDPDEILTARWFSIAEAKALSPEQVHRCNKLRIVLRVLQQERNSPCDSITDVPPEYWET